MKHLTPQTGALALTAALTLLNAQVGHCARLLNPQPLPPYHGELLKRILASLLHLTGFHF